MGQSITLTGRSIAKHMSATINELLTGKHDHMGDCIVYGDSVTGDAMIRLEDGSELTIAELYNIAQETGQKTTDASEKERVFDGGNRPKVMGYDSYEDCVKFGYFKYIMRHNTKKQLYKIEIEDGTSITVTEDHSLMVDRDGQGVIEVKPADLNFETDLIIGVDFIE